jgi:hypothetical protein
MAQHSDERLDTNQPLLRLKKQIKTNTYMNSRESPPFASTLDLPQGFDRRAMLLLVLMSGDHHTRAHGSRTPALPAARMESHG